jgi:hypothetical protein
MMKFNLFKAVVPPLFSVLLAACVSAPISPDFYGVEANPALGVRTIEIGPNTRYVNVEGGEIIRFVSAGKEFGWHFMVAPTVTSFSLDQVAPRGLLDHPVRAYVSPDPRYIGGDGDRD